jgi:hypothetical protein
MSSFFTVPASRCGLCGTEYYPEGPLDPREPCACMICSPWGPWSYNRFRGLAGFVLFRTANAIASASSWIVSTLYRIGRALAG